MQPVRHTLHQSGGEDRLASGDRAPHAPLRGAAAQQLRIFSLLHGGHLTLLSIEIDANAVDALGRPGLRTSGAGSAGDVVDPNGQFQRIYGMQARDLVLVRPDS